MSAVADSEAGPIGASGHSEGSHANILNADDKDGEHECTLFFYAKTEVKRPCCSCCGLCCGLALWFLLLIVLLAGGVEVLRFETDVPFYLYESTVYKRQTYLLSGFDVANARLGADLNEREDQEEDFVLRIIYELDGPNALFSPEVLGGIQTLEESIVAHVEYTDFCALNYEFDESNPVCVRQSSPVFFFDPVWFLPATSPPPQPTVPSVFNANYLINGSTLAADKIEDYYPFANPQDTSAVSTLDLSQENVDTTLAYWAGYCSSTESCPAAANGDSSPYALTYLGANVTITSQILNNVDTTFGINGEEVNPDAVALMSVFYFGSPQRRDNGELYEIDTDGMEDQTDNLGTFLFDSYDDLLQDGIEGVNVFWDGNSNGMVDVYVNNILFTDVLLLGPTFLFVLFYLIFQLRSWWLGGVGMLMVLGNFGPALLLYRAIAGYSYFGTLNALSIFVILGIGADDIFVFTDSWKNARRTMPQSSVLEQLMVALHTGGKAMAVTSLTTAISFLSNATSDFPAVQSFGIFSAFLVICNFFSVVIIYPAVTLAYEYHMHDPLTKGGLCKSTFHCCKSERGYPQSTKDGEVEEKSVIALFFEKRFFPFILKFKKLILVGYVVVMIFYIAIGSQLVPDSEAPSLIPDSDQYKEVSNKLTDYFARSVTSNRVTVDIPFGIAGTDRDDCSGDPCDPTIPSDYGTPVWDDNLILMNDEYAQKWMLDFCDAVENAEDASDVRKIYPADDSNPSPVSCIHHGLQRWCQEDSGRCNQTHPVLATSEYIVDADVFYPTLITFLESSIAITDPNFAPGRTNYDIWQENIRGENINTTQTGIDTTLRYISVNALLTVASDFDFDKGIKLYEDWVEFVEEWKVLSTNTAIYGEEAGTAYASGFVTDGGFFHYFYLQDKIISEAFTGMALSLLFAFLILCIATRNWLVSLMATFTITSMVGGVVAFTVLNGWKLGVLEAVLFVMVVGFSVDYTIHLSDAYLESHEKTREERTEEMLVVMGISVLSGALSTIGACVPLLFAYMVFFLKFGTTILFIIAQSLIFSLLFYSTMLVQFGPELPKFGKNIKNRKRVVVQLSPPHDDKGSGHTPHAEAHAEHFRSGRVTAVDAGSETCTIELDTDDCIVEGTEVINVPISTCRLKNEIGSITAIDSAWIWLHRTCMGHFGKKKVVSGS